VEPQRFVFAVDQVYKGEVRAHQWITSFGGRGTCGLELSGNGQFVMFAETASDVTADLDVELYSGLCSGNRLLDAGAVPGQFGPGHAPIAGASPMGRFDDGGSAVAPILIGAAVVAAFAVAAMFVASRKARTV
jgi:hypothetical protein